MRQARRTRDCWHICLWRGSVRAVTGPPPLSPDGATSLARRAARVTLIGGGSLAALQNVTENHDDKHSGADCHQSVHAWRWPPDLACQHRRDDQPQESSCKTDHPGRRSAHGTSVTYYEYLCAGWTRMPISHVTGLGARAAVTALHGPVRRGWTTAPIGPQSEATVHCHAAVEDGYARPTLPR